MTEIDKLDRLIALQEEHLRWARLTGTAHLKEILRNTLKSDKEVRVYQLSDGENSIREIEKITKMKRSSIFLLWRKWYNVGIMERSNKHKGTRMKRSFSVSDVGVGVESAISTQEYGDRAV